ncbi:major facilitator superfamily domain-containing protein 6-B-like [Thrips palmi]|uniref:Major facilitator superfamily domain-containing protein 6-B-like n=1 Tax=Thrips palmi TaxID=161013 RepID=A0A6P8ZNU6_THRPL|nr:major facilitator superfamily domain-containing protein 6-B-like [Thrips palmi]
MSTKTSTMSASSFCRRIAEDFKHKELLPLKMLFFVHASTMLVLYPYLTIHMRELGISVEETAIMSAVTPVVAIVMPPVAGVIADRIGNFKLMLALFSSLGGLAALLLLAVPVGRYNVKYSDRVYFSVGCPGSSLEAVWADQNPCRAVPWDADGAPVNLTLDSCGVVCSADFPDATQLNHSLRAASRFSLRISDDGAHSDTFSYNLATPRPAKAYTGHGAPGPLDARLLPDLGVMASPAAPPRVYFPTPGLHTLRCEDNDDNATMRCLLGREGAVGHGNPQQQRYRVAKLDPLPSVVRGARPVPAVCGDTFAKAGRSASVWLASQEPQSPATSLSQCVASCLASAPRIRFCSNMQDVVEVDPSFTFWMYLIVRVFVGVIGGTSFAMFEGAVIAILREHNGDYGLQRIYASIGGMISSPLSGILIDYASAGRHYTDFRPAFYLYAALKLASGLLMLRIDLQFKAPAKNVVGDVLHVLKNVEMVALFVVCFLLGTAWGYIENFLFWLLQDLGGSRSLMGITVTVGGIAGIPLLVLSGPIIERVGHANVLFVGFVFYAIRLFGYSMIYNPWLCLVFEAMESFTSSLATTAAVTYAATLSSSSTDTSVQGLIGGLYYGVGKGAGSLIGGYLMKAVGTRNTYRVFAAGSLGAGLVYFMLNHFYLRHLSKANKARREAKVHSDKDHEACVMSDIAKDKCLSKDVSKDALDKPNNTVILNNKAACAAAAAAAAATATDAVQQKNNRNSALLQQQPPAADANKQGTEKAPLARLAALRDYSSSGDTSAPRRFSAHLATPSAAEGEDTVRRRKSTDCGLGGGPKDPVEK